ncbi:Hypothetical predicted protein, partial [Paramuricea clavata]
LCADLDRGAFANAILRTPLPTPLICTPLSRNRWVGGPTTPLFLPSAVITETSEASLRLPELW